VSITIHQGTTFLISDELGNIAGDRGSGLYCHDSRFLSRYEMTLARHRLIALTARARHGYEGVHFLTNDASIDTNRGTFGVVRFRQVNEGLHEQLRIENFSNEEARLFLGLELDADFAHIFAVKRAEETGSPVEIPDRTVEIERRDERTIALRATSVSDVPETVVRFSEVPSGVEGGRVWFEPHLRARSTWALSVDVDVAICTTPGSGGGGGASIHVSGRGRRTRDLVATAAELECDHDPLERAYRRASLDLASLRIDADEVADGYAIAAGIPWFLALFGRDSLITSFQSLLHDPSLARGTLRTLASRQGRKVNPVTGEEPGKILHEHRNGPISGADRIIPEFPYYGSIDSTPLFLITLSEYVRCTGDFDLFVRLRDNAELAVRWLIGHIDRNPDGLITYQQEGDLGLANQGWKDSWDSVRFHDGRLAEGPIALVEVQGYAIDALRRTAELFERIGDAGLGRQLRRRAQRLRAVLTSRFRLVDRAFFAEALDGAGRCVDALTSNPGHLLWSQVLTDTEAKLIGQTLLSEDLFSGFGIRSMGVREGAYNPLSYHNGSIWPHDCSLILAGLARYGLRNEAASLAAGMLSAVSHFPDRRLPELFAGYSSDYGLPVDYPTSNRPQAWASGAIILLVRALLGIEIDAPAKRLTTRPIAAPNVSELMLRRVPVGDALVDFELAVRDGEPRVRAHGLPGDWRHEQYLPERTGSRHARSQ
jgi:glycogen debranching enzyme